MRVKVTVADSESVAMEAESVAWQCGGLKAPDTVTFRVEASRARKSSLDYKAAVSRSLLSLQPSLYSPVSRSLASLDPCQPAELCWAPRMRLYSFPWRRRSTHSHIVNRTVLRIGRRFRYVTRIGRRFRYVTRIGRRFGYVQRIGRRFKYVLRIGRRFRYVQRIGRRFRYVQR